MLPVLDFFSSFCRSVRKHWIWHGSVLLGPVIIKKRKKEDMLLAKIKRVKLEIYEFYLYLRRVTCSKFLIPEESYM